MEKARCNTELYSNLRAPFNNVKPSNFWGSHQSPKDFAVTLFFVIIPSCFGCPLRGMCFKRFLLKSNTKVAVEVEIVDTTHNLRKYIALSGQQLLLRGVSTPGHGQGEGPVGSKLSRSDDAYDDGRGRSERSKRSPLRSKLLTLLLTTHK